MLTYFLQILVAEVLTLEIALGSLVVAMFLGMLGASAKLSQNKVLRWSAEIYSTVVRGIPDLVLMLLIFYGGQIAINNLLETLNIEDPLEINPFIAGMVTLGFIYGAYMTETFRGAIMAISRGQIEAGYAYGLTPWMVFRRITFPQMMRLALPGFTNNWLVLIKSTALVSVIGLHDMTYIAKQVGAATRSEIVNSSLIFFLFTAAIYLLVTTLSLWALRALNQRLSLGVAREISL